MLTVRAGRVAFFAHDPRPFGEPPGAVRKWLDHERAVIQACPQPTTAPNSDWTARTPWVVWRLLSGNNREIARGVGVFDSVAAARAAAERTMAVAWTAEAVYTFDRRVNHGWCLRLEDEALMVSPMWHRSKRSNRLNLATVRMALGHAEFNEAATQLSGPSRMREVTP